MVIEQNPSSLDRFSSAFVPEEPVINGEYPSFLRGLTLRIAQAQRSATLAVNRELILLYWQVGRDIVARQAAFGWGGSIIDRLARDLALEAPGMEGLSARNLWRMRAFYLAYADAAPAIPILPQAVAELEAPPWIRAEHWHDCLSGPK